MRVSPSRPRAGLADPSASLLIHISPHPAGEALVLGGIMINFSRVITLALIGTMLVITMVIVIVR